jgi:signal transduction histidine kinase
MMALSSYLQYNSARNAHIIEINNHLNSLSNAKRLRLKGIILKRQEHLLMLQTRESLRENFSLYLNTRNRRTQLTLKRSMELIRDRIPSFKEMHLVAPDGKVISSTSNNYLNADFSTRDSFKHAMRGELCMHETFFDSNKDLSIMLSGILDYEDTTLGVLMIEMEADDILSIINDYTGLGESGETTIARRIPGSKIYYITPTRFHTKPGDSLIVTANSGVAMDMALRGKNGILLDILDYRGEEVLAVPSYISETGWGLVTKIDRKEALKPISTLLYNTLIVTGIFVVIVVLLAYFFAGYIVKPIEELCKATWDIAQGKQIKQVHFNSRNEVGKLADNFNLMTDKLEQSKQALNTKIEELDRINNSLNQFAYVVSHDLKSPVHSISGLMAYLKKKLAPTADPDVQKLIVMTEQKSQHMLDLINGILNYAKAGSVEEEQVTLELNTLIENLLPHLDVPEHIDISRDELPVITFEKVLMIQIFQNLIGNAVKYMDKPLGWIKIGYTLQDADHLFSVSDNGRGIDKKHFEKVFDLFNKTHDLKGIDSSGIGLSIVKRIVESRGGKIWLESELGAGSTFYFTIPTNHSL